MNDTQLKPCPFCGSEATGPIWVDWAYRVICETCYAYGPRFEPEATGEHYDDHSIGLAIEAWNTSATPKVKSLVWEIYGIYIRV